MARRGNRRAGQKCHRGARVWSLGQFSLAQTRRKINYPLVKIRMRASHAAQIIIIRFMSSFARRTHNERALAFISLIESRIMQIIKVAKRKLSCDSSDVGELERFAMSVRELIFMKIWHADMYTAKIGFMFES